jgi:CubicO group peptidase (beta-lactamase class C family)
MPAADGTLQVFGPDAVYALNPLINAAGNLSMTSKDFARFVQLHLEGMTGQSAQLSSDTFVLMDTRYSGFSLGVWNGTRVGKAYICLDGTAGTYYARGVIVHESNIGFTIMTNCGSEKAVEFMTTALLKAYYNWWWMFWI